MTVRHDLRDVGLRWPPDCTLGPELRRRLEERWERLKRYGMELRPCALAPPEAFSDELAPLDPGYWFWPRIDPDRTGPRSATIEARLGLGCAGWIRQPTPAEFHEAVHAENPSPRQQTIVYAWALESTETELVHAWAERAYSWRTLVTALHNADFDVYPRIRIINHYALVGETSGFEPWED